MSRYALKGRRPGESYYITTEDGKQHRIQFHAIDGGATLTDAQRKYFEDDGVEVEQVADTAPIADVDPAQQEHDLAYETALNEAIAAGASAGHYGTAPKTLKTFSDVAAVVAPPGATEPIVPRNRRRHPSTDLGAAVVIPADNASGEHPSNGNALAPGGVEADPNGATSPAGTPAAI